MSNCCLKNLGCLQIPVSTITQAGQAGATNTLTIGTVSTGAAAASITGTSPNQVLNLTIPQGIQGNPGTSGTTRLYSFVGNDTSLVTSSWDTLETYTLLANALSNNGDSVLIQATSTCTTGSTSPPFSAAQRRITFGGSINSTTIISPLEPFYLDANTSVTARYITSVEIIRTSSNTATCRVVLNQSYSSPNLVYETQLTGLNFTINNDIDFDVFQPIASQVALRTLTIDLFAI